MKSFAIAAALLLSFGLSSSSSAAPGKTVHPGVKLPGKKGPSLPPGTQVNPGAKKGSKKAPAVLPSESGTHAGVVKSMTIAKNGDIQEIFLDLSGHVSDYRIDGCGAKSAAHPLLNQFFLDRRLVRITTDGSGCFVNVLLSR